MKPSNCPFFVRLPAIIICLTTPSLACSTETEDWQLVWNDEFEADGKPNPQWWDYEEGYLRNEELQYYTIGREENARIQNGTLIIEARKDGFQGHSITSASLHSRRSASWTYGKIEVRAQVAGGRGTWPAIWMLGDTIDDLGWPHCGEIDIMEYVGYDPRAIHGTIHTTAYNHIQNTARGSTLLLDDLTTSMHRYSVEWDPIQMRFFVDDLLYFTFDNDGAGDDATWPFHRPQHLKLNLAIGGGWGGAQGVDDSIFPAKFLIDYVRVYQRKEPPPYKLTLTANGPGLLRIEPEKTTYEDGEIVTLVADPNLGKRLGKWKNIQLPRSLRAPLTINRDLQLTADFIDPNSLNQNPDFTQKLSNWYNWIGGGAVATLSTNDQQQALIAVTKSGAAAWHVQFGQGGLKLETGKRYQLQFEAKIDTGAPTLIAALTMNSEPFTAYTSKTIELSQSFQTFTIDYTHNAATNPNTRIEFDLGTTLGSIVFEQITLRSLDDDRLTHYEIWKRDHAIRPIDDSGDPDHDDRPNIVEYLWQSDPTQPDPSRSAFQITPSPSGLPNVEPTQFPSTEGIEISIEQSQDLKNWNEQTNGSPPLPFKRLKLQAPPPIDD